MLKRDNGYQQFTHTKEFKDENMVEATCKSITSRSVVIITKVKRRKIFQQASLLYDLTALQRGCNIHYDLPVGETLAITQSLYEKKLVSYSRAGSRYIPQSVVVHIPVLLEKIAAMPEFREYKRSLDLSALSTQSVDAAKVTDRHALIITGIVPEGLSEAESTVYTLIAGRMPEAFPPPCKEELLLMECVCGGLDFHSRPIVITNLGWRTMFSQKKDRERDELGRDEGTASFTEGEEISVTGHGLSQKKTLPKSLYTEATLLAAVGDYSKEITDGQAHETVKDTGIDTPAAHTAITATPFRRDYIERPDRGIRPTEKGLYLYESIKDITVTSAKLTGTWEKALEQIEGRILDLESFMLPIRECTGKVTGEILRLKLLEPLSRVLARPRCKTGNMVVKSKAAKCDRGGCELLMFRHLLNRELTDRHLEQFFFSGFTRLIKGLKGKKGVSLDAAATFDESFNLKLSFPKSKGGKGK